MKKQLLSIFAALSAGAAFSQTASPSWSTVQNAAFTQSVAGIRYMDAVDANVVWVMGYDGAAPRRNYNWVSRSINGGTSWNSGPVYASATTPAIGDTTNFVPANLDAIDANTAWVCAYQKGPLPYTASNTGGGVIYRTTNGGSSWTNMTGTGMFTNTAQSFANFVVFLTPQIGIAQGDPIGGVYEIWRTTNGGLSWSQIPSANIPAPSSTGEYGIVNLYAKYGSANMWWGTNEGRIFYTNNAGLTWNVATCAASSSTITEIAFVSATQGVAYAVNAGNTFEMYNTTNGGVTWTQIATVSPNVGLNDICGVPGTNQFVSAGAGTGNQIISYSNDNGVTWTDYGSTGIQYLTVDFGDNTTGWAGSFSTATANIGGIFKYSGAAITTTALPTSIFAVAPNLCLTGPTATAAITNSSTGVPAPSYTWTSFPAGPVFSNANAANPTVTFSSAGSYTIVLLTANATGTHAATQVVDVQACSLPTPAFTAPTTTICNNNNVTTNNTTTGGSPAPSYFWSASPSNGVTFSPSPIALNPVMKFATPGTYTISMVATNSQGSVAATSQTVSISDCRPALNYTLPVIFDHCRTADTLRVQNNTLPTNGSNTYTWSVQPTSGATILGANALNLNLRITHPSIKVYTVTLRSTNASGTSTLVQTFSVELSNCTGINENYDLSGLLKVYPNPAHDVLNIELQQGAGNYNVILTNILGQKVLEQKLSASGEAATLNLATQTKGVYFLTIEVNKQKVTRKIVIE